jgi:hypothetical protein
MKDGVSNSKNYATNPNFTKMCVDEKGRFAIGSENGELRLYN